MKFRINSKQYGFLLESEIASKKYDAILIGGLEHREGDKPLSEQISLLASGLGKFNIKGFHHNDSIDKILNFMEQNPKKPIYLFSAGCVHSKDISASPHSDLSRIYVIEPFAPSRTTKKSVEDSVSNGVPSYNVFVGPTSGRGLGVIKGARSSRAKSHWDALTTVGSMTK